MTESVVFDINGDPKGAERAFARLQKELDKTKQKVADLTAESRKAESSTDRLGKAGDGMAASFTKGLTAGLTLTAALTAATRVLGAEIDNVHRRQQRAAQTIIGTANSEMNMLRNVSPQDHSYWRSQVGGMAKRTGQTVASVQQAIADASSAQGNQSNDQLRRNVELAMMVAPENPLEAQTIAGGLGDATRLTGSLDERVNMGAILAMGKQARVRSTPKIAENLIPGAVSVKGYGGSANEAMAINTTLSTLMNDQQGDKTQGSATRIASELDRIYGEKASPLEHITALQNNPKLLAKWYKGTKGMPKADIPTHAEIAFKDLVTKGSEADKLLRSNLGGFGSEDDMRQLTGNWLKSAYASAPQKIAQADRGLGASTDQMQLSDLKGGRTGSLRERIFGDGGVLKSSRATAMANQLYAWQFDAETAMGRSPEGAAEAALVRRQDSIKRIESQAIGVTDAERKENKEMIVRLDAIISELRKNRLAPKPKNVDAHIE